MIKYCNSDIYFRVRTCEIYFIIRINLKFNSFIDFGLSALHDMTKYEKDSQKDNQDKDYQSYLIRKRPNFNNTTCGTLSYIAPEILELIESEDDNVT